MKDLRTGLVLLSFLICAPLFSQPLDMDYVKQMKPRSIGPGGMSGRVTAIAAEKRNDAVIYVGTASGGLWKTTNGGVRFTPVFDKEAVSSIGALAIAPSNEDVIWAGTGEGNPRNSLNGGYGIYKSLDRGRNWKLMGLEGTRHIHRILIHPQNPDIVYVGAIGSPWGPHRERGVYKSIDGGASWDLILHTNELSGVADMIMDPGNPDKLFVAMWEHQRQPWYFNSGGEGSGLYMSVDAGKNWKQLGEKEGLPKGKLGRIGLAISKSNNSSVYALVEAEKNALYRSQDGGYSWKVRESKNVGGRPFYYSDIFVDPENENRIYSLATRVTVSEDGGDNFHTLLGGQIHVDHHSWWINPEKPAMMIDGNDGGMAITYDHGKSWRHVSNLPVSQFYHISVDMAQPYHVMGGMQDNGSWRGPGYVWKRGGIINTYWDFLMGGDGFDVMAVPDEPEKYYAMSQGGNIRRMDVESGLMEDVKPAPEDDIPLRFHWNAALAQDPMDPACIYFGSQFVHKSSDKGNSWTRISPDLTTNDTARQKAHISGGLTYDVTGAENYCCILAIEPSKLQKDLIWVGTDDGHVQLTRDGGESWVNCSPRIGGLPEAAWIPMIVASPYSPGEAWVVANNYRLNDYEPYLFHTTDFGKKWERVAGPSQVEGYALSFAQDPLEPRLMFLGTEYGLWISIDGGKQWSKWTNGFPTVPVMDMVIHPREHDLVIGTFGRSAWVLDDIAPLRAIAADGKSVKKALLYALDAPDACLLNYSNAPGYYFTGDAYFKGENKAYGASLSCFVKLDTTKETKDTLKICIFDKQGEKVRTLEQVPENGLNRINWGLDRKGFRLDLTKQGRKASKKEATLGSVLPGDYQVKFIYGGDTLDRELSVHADPRNAYDHQAMLHSRERLDELSAGLMELNSALQELRDCRKGMKQVAQVGGKHLPDTVKNAAKEVEEELKQLEKTYMRDTEQKGLLYPSEAFYVTMGGVGSLYYSSAPLTPNQLQKCEHYQELAAEAVVEVEEFLKGPWKVYREAVQQAELRLLKN